MESLRQGADKNTSDIKTQRRREVTVALRKSKEEKKEEQMAMRRELCVNALMPSPDELSSTEMAVKEIIDAMLGGNAKRQFEALQAARVMLGAQGNPPIDLMVKHGIVPICVAFLQQVDKPSLQCEAASTLTNITTATGEQTRYVIDHNAVPYLVALLNNKSFQLVEKAVLALGNIAGDSAAARDVVLQNKVVDGLLHLITLEMPLSLMHNIVWLILNLCRTKNPPPSLEDILRLLPVLSQLLTSTDLEMLQNACWALAYVTDEDALNIEAVVDTGAVPRLIQLLSCQESNIVLPALRSVGNIVAGTDAQTDAVIDAGGLHMLVQLLQSPNGDIVKVAAWAVSNITAGTEQQIRKVLDSSIFVHIRNILQNGHCKAQTEAAWAVTNLFTAGTPEQIADLIEKFGIFKPFLDLLDTMEASTIKVVQIGLSQLFLLTEKIGGTENLCSTVEVLGGLDKLKALQSHQNEEVCKKACALIINYISSVRIAWRIGIHTTSS